MLRVILVVTTVAVQGSVLHNRTKCPPGFLPRNNSEQTCSCGNIYPRLDEVHCNDSAGSLEVVPGKCVSLFSGDSILIASCPYNNRRISLPLNTSLDEWNSKMCTSFSRKGKLCSECVESYLPTMSHTMHCSKCDPKFGWIKYLSLQIIPSTVFFVLIMIFDIPLLKSPLRLRATLCS